jgi:hypothetical protein
VSFKATEVSRQKRQDIDFQKMAPPMTLRDEELVARINDGEDWATEELVNRYQEKSYAIAYHMC